MANIPLGRVPSWHAERRPGATAVACGSDSISWSELANNVRERSIALQEIGVTHNDIVAVSQPNCIDLIANIFAVWAVGGCIMPLAPVLAAEERNQLLTLAPPRLVIGLLDSKKNDLNALPADWRPQESDKLLPDMKPASEWKIMASGGSTGLPKLIVAKQPAVTDPAKYGLFPWDRHHGRLGRPNGVMLCPGPLYHNGPFVHAFMNLIAGSTLIMMERFDAAEALALIPRYRVEFAYFVPTMMRRILRLPDDLLTGTDLTSLKGMIHTASACPTDLKREWMERLGPERVWETYGSTEAIASTLISGEEWLTRPGSVGQFFFGSKGEIRSPEGDVLPHDEIGEIWVRPGTNGASFRYIGSEDVEQDGWYSFGDLGSMDSDGFLYIADRRSDLIIRGGSNIYPAEIEAALEAHPDVIAAAAIGIADEDLGQKVHAIVQAHAELDPEMILAFLRDKLAKYKLPQSFSFTQEALREPSGKLRRSGLRDKYVAQMNISE